MLGLIGGRTCRYVDAVIGGNIFYCCRSTVPPSAYCQFHQPQKSVEELAEELDTLLRNLSPDAPTGQPEGKK